MSSGATSDSDSQLDASIASIDNVLGWGPVVNLLCKHFNIPDLSRSSGLKKIHANFDTIYRKLEKAYRRNAADERIKGGIVGIYARMCTDVLLRNKLFKKGFISQLIPLIEIPSCRNLALQSLTTITHHGGLEVRMELAKTTTRPLLQVIKDFPDDRNAVRLAIITISHCLSACLTDGTEKNPHIAESLPLLEAVAALTDALRQPNPGYELVQHAIEFLAVSSQHCKLPQSTINLLVAGLRCKDWVFRATCLGGLVRMHAQGAQDDQRSMDPNAVMRCGSQTPPSRLHDIMREYGMEKCETRITLKTSMDYQKAMTDVVRDYDMYGLGKKLAEIILRTEFSIADGYFQFENPATGARETGTDIGLPFNRWIDALPLCAKAIRTKRVPAEADMADILDMKSLVMRQRVGDAVKIANIAIKRNPDFAYAYYIVTLSADRVAGLMAAKKGMKCTQMTPFVRFQMMQRAVEMAGDYGIQILHGSASEGDEKWAEGVAFLVSALEDSKSYMAQAPPDNRHHKNVLYWNILLRIAMEEHISGDLHEIEGSLRKLKTAEEFSKWMGVVPPKTQLRNTQQTVVKLLPAALDEWIGFISTVRTENEALETPNAEKIEQDLAAWMEHMDIDGGSGGDIHANHHHGHGKSTFALPFSSKLAELYRCSWCGNPSAALRKCSGCGKTRYCDGACQKQHWKKEHKQQCKPKD
ncbi:Bin3-type SAM domain-containing protein [Mycena chlorophos]|uniref:Bin3-type SAM domain-containing protein n=1 Tax=Mycena chlorophos TaxID=658473 RepID=A0A8H6TJ55_MYCCL|nr:Bin3-type SAM domain-containing protein [Mycena chlorophos]